jgi:hypothetical protein
LYRRLTREFTKGQTRYYDQAIEQIREITEATLSVSVSNIFLPDSELQFSLNARNVRRVEFALYRIDLTSDVRFTKNIEEDEGEGEVDSWVQRLRVAWPSAAARLVEANRPQGRSPALQRGSCASTANCRSALTCSKAKSGSLSARDLVLVPDVSLVLKSSPKQALVYFANAITGAPGRERQRHALGKLLRQRQMAFAPSGADHQQ